MRDEQLTIGVEEEFQLVDRETRRLEPVAEDVLPGARARLGDDVEHELHLAQIETGTPVCTSLRQVRQQLARLRRAVSAAAEEQGYRVALAGSHPFGDWRHQQLTPKAAYERLGREYAQLAQQQLVFGCHVHVCVPDREQRIQVLNRVRPWLAPVLAISASSPFWERRDTGHRSYRSLVFGRWPTTGTPGPFRDWADYESLVDAMLSTHAIDDPARLYWNVRPSNRYETIEVRIADACTTLDEAVLVAGLVRGLVRTALADLDAGRPEVDVRPEVLRAAEWRAARYGLGGLLINPVKRRDEPAPDVVGALLAHVRDGLDDLGEWEEVRDLLHGLLISGTSADRQKAALHRSGGRWEAVVDHVAAETLQRVDEAASSRIARSAAG